MKYTAVRPATLSLQGSLYPNEILQGMLLNFYFD
jgi:hypothetical protein